MPLIYLLLAIILTSSLILLFRVFERFNVEIPHAIVVNYFVAASMGYMNYEGTLSPSDLTGQPGLWVAVTLGLLFISIFNMIAITTSKMGVSVASVANKMSVIIPVAAAIYMYDEDITAVKIAGIVLALLAVYFTSLRQGDDGSAKPSAISYLFLPIIVFLGSGLIDLLINYSQKKYLAGNAPDLFISTAFTVAGIIGLIMVIYQVLVMKKRFSKKSIIAGVALGIPNYLSIYCLVKTLETSPLESSVIFPVVNIGIVLFSVICARAFFREKLSKINVLGIAISLIAITLVAWEKIGVVILDLF
jgi:drug/metabolite transporter (DMT)-like permease